MDTMIDTQALIQHLAESCLGWSGPEDYAERRAWLARHRGVESVEATDPALLRLYEPLNNVNAVCLENARETVELVVPYLRQAYDAGQKDALQGAHDVLESEEREQWRGAARLLPGAQIVAQRIQIMKKVLKGRIDKIG